VETGLFASQRPLWIGQQLHRGCPLYNMAFAFVLHDRIDADAFGHAWSQLVGANEALRTVVIDRAGTPARHILPAP